MPTLNISIASNMAEFNAVFARYLAFTSKLPDEALEKKGRDLGIKLYQGFASHRWSSRSLAYREFRARLRAGKGTLVRQRFISERWADQIPLTQKTTRRGQRAGRDSRNTYPTSTWQRLVAQELLRRRYGGGALAASFLWTRRAQRYSTSQQQYVGLRTREFVRNKAGQTLGTAEHTSGVFRITGNMTGLATIAQRYGVVSGAIETARQDMVQYLRDRHLERYRKIFREDPR